MGRLAPVAGRSNGPIVFSTDLVRYDLEGGRMRILWEVRAERFREPRDAPAFHSPRHIAVSSKRWGAGFASAIVAIPVDAPPVRLSEAASSGAGRAALVSHRTTASPPVVVILFILNSLPKRYFSEFVKKYVDKFCRPH
jgi:hypothetical protein